LWIANWKIKDSAPNNSKHTERKHELVRFSGPLLLVFLQLREGDAENEAGGML
jgi:hypothetical protein